MRLLSTSRGHIRGTLGKSGTMLLFFLLAFVLSCHCCPKQCECSSQAVKCQNRELDKIPHSIPENTSILFVTGNRISRISEASFPARLLQLTELYLSGNEMEHVDAMAFKNLPNLQRLDLSNNRLLTLNKSAFPEDNKMQLLNLSRSFPSHFFTDMILSFLQNASLVQLTTLDLSNNYLVTLPDGVFASLSSLVTLDLQNSSLISIQNGTLKLPQLRDLDLRDNNLRDLPTNMLAEIGPKPDLHIQLAGNPWRCDCVIDNMLIWLKNSTQVVDAENLTCTEPEAMRQQPLLQLELSQLKCSSNMEGVLETSYVFLGLVLALIGVIFLLVLYLNRKGIKRWMYNIRDACRDHMEGYHYRYEINSDPRLANLSINSDV
ncbi:trophoblast glycoprotein [Xenentodon cancila]